MPTQEHRVDAADSLLPEGFADLEPFVAQWVLADEPHRMQKRWSSSMDDIVRFYEAMVPRVEAALDFLDSRNINALAPAETRLLHLTFSLVEIANSVEVYSRPSSPHALQPDRYVPVDRL